MKICIRCGKEFARKDNLNRHLSNKTLCEAIYLNIDGNEIIKNYNKYYKQYLMMLETQNKHKTNTMQTQNQHKTNTMQTQNQHKTNTDNEDTNDHKMVSNQLKCNFCEREFTHRNSLYRHKKKYCEKIKLEEENESKRNELFSLLIKEKEEKKELKEQLMEDKEKIEKLQKDLFELRLKLGINGNENNSNNDHNHSHNTANHSHNTNTNANNTNSNNVIITINDYGKEDYSKITEEECKQLIESDFDIILKLVEMIHIDDPENMNIYIASLKEKYAMILKNQEWAAVDRTEFLKKLMIEKSQILHDLINKYEQRIANNKVIRIRRVIDMSLSDEEEYERLFLGLLLLIYNSNKAIRQNYETRYHERMRAR